MKFRGRVIEGQKLARTLGVPTANLSLPQRPQIKDGVWLARVSFDGKIYGGILHAGVRQTDKQWALEVHLLEFDGELLGKVLEVETVKFLRETKRFNALSALKAQIHLDVIEARKFFLRETIRTHWEKTFDAEREALAEKAFEEVSNLSVFQSSSVIYAFAPDALEINYVQKLCSKFPEKQFAFPYVRAWDMKFYISQYEDLVPGNFNILEPLPEVLASKPDLILVPAQAAAFTGERLGRGGGYYDVFLSDKDIPTVCVLPEWAVLKDLPSDARDQRVGKVIGV
jgi:5,10-methenyltetrahydrofolate synthetase